MIGKTYQRYLYTTSSPIICSNASTTMQVLEVRSPGRRSIGTTDVVAFVPALENVAMWSLRTGMLIQTLAPYACDMTHTTTLRDPASTVPNIRTKTNEVTSLLLVPGKDGRHALITGYANGYVAYFRSTPSPNHQAPLGLQWQCDIFALGHRTDTAVLSIAQNTNAYSLNSKNSGNIMLFCTGGLDTDISVWDITAQEPLYRLRGHRGNVTGLSFVNDPSPNRLLLVSGAADGLVKVWDLFVQQCVQSLVATDTQITSLRYLFSAEGGSRLAVGLSENKIKFYSIDTNVTNETAKNIELADQYLKEHGFLTRKSQKAVTNIALSPDGRYLCLQSARTLEFYSVASAEVVKRRMAKRRRKQQKKNADSSNQKRPRDDASDDDSHEDMTNDNAKNDGNDDNADLVSKELTHLRSFNFSHILSASEKDAADINKESGKIRAFSFCPLPLGSSADLHISVMYNTNAIETFTATERDADATTGASATRTLTDLRVMHSLSTNGHRGEIRSVSFTDNDEAIISLSSDALCLWGHNYVSMQGANQNYALDDDEKEAARELLLDEAFYNNTAPPPAELLVAIGTVHPQTIAEHMTSLSSSTVSAAEFTCCAIFGSDMVGVGDKRGGVHIVNLKTGGVMYTEPAAHSGPVKHMEILPDSSGFTSIGADRRIVTWSLALIKSKKKDRTGGEDSHSKKPTLTLQLAHELELTEQPLFIRYSKPPKDSNGQSSGLFAVGLQDHNIQIFYADTSKPFLSLYGHSLVPTDVAFSDDGHLIASVGVDKSLRFWGADYGDCHKAIHAHDDSITSVSFVPKTHFVFTSSLDGSIKHWDGDNWTMIQVFRCHQRALMSLAINSNGSHVVAGGEDRCLRLLQRSDETLFPEEEESAMAQQAMDDEAARRAALQRLEEKGVEVGVAGQVTASSTSAAETLMEAIDLVSVEVQRAGGNLNTVSHATDKPAGDVPTSTSILLRGRSVWEYLWSVIDGIRPTELRHVLSALTSIHLAALLQYLSQMDRVGAIGSYETAAKVLLALVAPAPGSGTRPLLFFDTREFKRTKSNPTGASHDDHNIIDSPYELGLLRDRIAGRLQGECDDMEGNVAALRFLMARLKDKERIEFFDVSKIQGYKKKYN